MIRIGNQFTGGTGVSFTPTYNVATNQITSSPFTYDGNGNSTHDNAHTYTWDAEGKAITIDGTAVALTYDARGLMVEQNRGGSYTQIVYGLGGGKLALMNGQTLAKAFVPLPAGAVAVYASGGLSYFRHPDWLGSSRISSDPNHNVVSDLAYAPYGETYAESGTPDRSFTGQNQDTIANSTTGLYDFLFRRYAQYGRWISPDPAGFSAVSIVDPQSWNRYAYVRNNPLNLVDPVGFDISYNCEHYDEGCGGGYGGGLFGGGGPYTDTGYCPPQYAYCGDDPFWIGIGIGGGGGGGGGGNPAPAPAPNPPSTGGKPPLSGETLGIPNGMRIPAQNPWTVLLPTDPTCEFGPCVPIANGALDTADVIKITIGACTVFSVPCGWIALGGAAVIACIHVCPTILEFARRKPDIRVFDDAVKEIERRCGFPLSEDQKRRLHESIHGQGYGYHDIVTEGVNMFCPGK